MEIWKPVRNYENLYEVSNLGRIRSKDRLITNQYDINTGLYNNTRISKGKILIGSIGKHGYRRICLVNELGDRHYESVHVLVAQAFIPNPENKPVVDHKNTRKLDNRANNLRWATYAENTKYARELGLWKNVTFNKKPVLNLTTGKQYESAIEAAKDVHKEIPTSKVETIMKNIKACCYGKQKSAYKYQWKHL